jgi:high-affinity nickel-transport protein
MTASAADAVALVVVVLLLGLRHGLDPDHLATIDGLVRCNAPSRPRLARFAGLLFSIGHGVVVTLVALAVATVANHWQAPGWLEPAGAIVSIAFLLALGAANLAAVLRAGDGRFAPVAGLRSRLLGGLARTGHPVVIAAVGAAFALSFDTMSQAALFSLTGSKLAGWPFALALGGVFTLGMAATDAANGLWIAGLVRRSDARGARASRVMGLAIALIAFAIATSGIARFGSSSFAEGFDALGSWTGAGVLVTTLATFAIARALGRNRVERA